MYNIDNVQLSQLPPKKKHHYAVVNQRIATTAVVLGFTAV